MTIVKLWQWFEVETRGTGCVLDQVDQLAFIEGFHQQRGVLRALRKVRLDVRSNEDLRHGEPERMKPLAEIETIYAAQLNIEDDTIHP